MKYLRISLLCLFFTETLFGSELQEISHEPERSSFNYVSFGMAFVLPQIGFGHRWQSFHVGYDLSLDAASLGVIGSVLGTGKLLYFFSGGDHSPYAGVGFGFGIGYAGELGGAFISVPQGTIGYKISKKQFIECNVAFPIADGDLSNFPVPIIKYGIGF